MAKKTFPSDQQDQFMVRMPEGMRDRIKTAAEQNNRSMNAEIVATLEEQYPEPLSVDVESFVAKWIEPLLDHYQNTRWVDKSDPKSSSESEEFKVRGVLLNLADRAAKTLHPNLGVWESEKQGRLELIFGIRDISLLPPDKRSWLLQSFEPVRWRIL